MKKSLLLAGLLGAVVFSFAQVNIDKAINLAGSGTDAKVMGIKSVTDPQDAINVETLQKGTLQYAGVTSTSGTPGVSTFYALGLNPPVAAYTTGMLISFNATNGTEGILTVNVNSLGIRTVKKKGNIDLVTGDVAAGQLITLIFDGTNFQLVNPVNSTGGMVTGSGSATRIPFWSGTSTLSSDAGLNWDNTNKRLGVGTASPGVKFEVAATATGGQYLAALRAGGNAAGDLPAIQWLSSAGTNKLEMWTDALNGVSRIKSAGSLSLHAGNVGFSATNEFVTLLSSGNLGIGTTTPDGLLHVSGSTSLFYPKPGIADYTSAMFSNNADATIRFRHIGGLSRIHTDGGQALSLATNGQNDRVYITPGGNVGIGTNAPDGLLHSVGTILSYPKTGVADYTSVVLTNNQDATIRIRHNAGMSRIYTDGNQGIHIATNGQNDRITVLSGGNVGVGHTNPAAKLTVLQNTNSTDGGLRSYNTGQTQWTALYSGGDNGSYFQNQAGYVMISGAGNVGIGTTSPDGLLHVSGSTALFYPKPGIADYTSAMFSNNADATIRFRHNGGLSRIHTDGGQALSLATNGQNDRIYITSGGNVGIGAVPDRNLSLRSSGTGNIEIFDMLQPNTTTGSVVYGLIGRSAATGQSAILGYQYNSATNTSFAFLGNYGDSHASSLTVMKGGNVGIGNSAPQHQLNVGAASSDAQLVSIRGYSNTPASWKGGAAFGYTGASVIMGELNSIAQIGGHSSTLNAWAPLIINGGGGNVGIGTSSAPAYKLEVAGDVKVTGNLYAGVHQKVQEGSVSGVASFTISGLNGDVDKMYRLELHGNVTTAADRFVYITPNGLTGAQYFSHQHRGDASAGNIMEVQSALQGIMIARTVYGTSGTLSVTSNIFAQSGYRRQAHSQAEFYASQTQNGLTTVTGTWNDSATNITSLVVNFNGGTFTGNWRLYALRQ